MKKILGGLAMAALVAVASPAGAVPYTYTFNFSGNTGTSGTAGNTLNATDTTSAPGGGPSLSTHVSAYSKSGNGSTSGTVTKAYLGNYAGGLGVTNTSEGSGSGNTHTVDNQSGTDFIVFQFDQAVSLSSVLLDLYSLGGSTDSDISIGYGTTTYNPASGAVPFNNNSSFTSLGLTMLGPVTGGSSDPTTHNFNGLTANIYANTWVVMADLTRTGSTGYDAFKISSITLKTDVPAVPEPATWAMMISGFGFVGASLRRRNKKMALAA